MSYAVGDDVIVDFQGNPTPGEVLAVHKTSGFIMCRIHIDPDWDYGGVGSSLDPEPIVCVRHDRVTPAEIAAKE